MKSTFFKGMYFTFNTYFTFQGLELNVIFAIISSIYEVFVPEHIRALAMWSGLDGLRLSPIPDTSY